MGNLRKYAETQQKTGGCTGRNYARQGRCAASILAQRGGAPFCCAKSLFFRYTKSAKISQRFKDLYS